ncbi:unnamed protein product [Nezara viridula]|uniref:Odorant receptor n=1 Tax=Nezara viridula TaxID=85310 RepID=A0A9P0H8R9_NEZVI|nr:unnamed protein product [Nezara viridula]
MDWTNLVVGGVLCVGEAEEEEAEDRKHHSGSCRLAAAPSRSAFYPPRPPLDAPHLPALSSYYAGVLIGLISLYRHVIGGKSSVAATKVMAILRNGKSDSWETKTSLFDSMVSSTLLYAAEIWGTRYLKVLERTQVRFIKSLLHWPRNTPNYVTRLESGRSPLSVEVLKVINYWTKLSLMSDERLPRQCFNRLRTLDSSIGKPDPTYNWVSQVKMIVAELGCQGMLSCVFSQGLMRFKDEIMEKIRNHHASKDIDRVLNSKSNPRYRKICSFNVTRPEDYLQFRALNLNKLRAVSRLRVASSVLNVLMTITVVKIYKSDLVAAIENVHFIILVSAEILGMITLLRKRKLIISIYTLIGKDYFDYENTLDDECLETKRSAMEKAKRRKYFIQRIFVSCIFCACITVSVLRPVLKILYFDPSEGTPDDGFVRVAMVTVWTPFDKYQWYSVAFIWYCECVIAWNTPSIVFGSTFFFLFALEDLGVQLQLLKKSLANVIQRAKRIDGPIEEGIKLCLKYSIRHHQILFT